MLPGQLRQHAGQMFKCHIAVWLWILWRWEHEDAAPGRTRLPDYRELGRQAEYFLRLLRGYWAMQRDSHCQCFKPSLFRDSSFALSGHDLAGYRVQCVLHIPQAGGLPSRALWTRNAGPLLRSSEWPIEATHPPLDP